MKDGVFAFDTDYEVCYEIGLSVNTEILQMEVCAFDINNKNKKPSPNDRKLRDTILAIIEEFFRTNGGVLLYICATGDDMQKYRFRLFLRWFNTYEHRDLYEIRTVEDVMDDNTPNYGAIIVEKTHPDLELILARFDELAAFLKKPIE
ncbi:DUF6169 family protein [Prevotella sp. MA2016]|uniref:DUF6169 family protein n=1 Tax=Prevotella sp. MA2016 TaxID=1408310 RepID=UPI0012DE986E|nr:DUF6169 family protein [Prevotella sp. MA2016]